MSRIMQKEIKSEMNDFFFAKDHLDFYHEYVNVEQKYLAGIKEVRTKLEILDDEFHHRFDHNPIENGYRSLHLVVEVPVYLANEKVMVPVEIQIRTIAMDFWATLEHHLRYKNDKEISDDIRNRLSDCAKRITDIDYEMEDIHNEVFGHHKI